MLELAIYQPPGVCGLRHITWWTLSDLDLVRESKMAQARSPKSPVKDKPSRSESAKSSGQLANHGFGGKLRMAAGVETRESETLKMFTAPDFLLLPE